MSQQFLYEQLNSVSKMGFLKKEIPDFVEDNLNKVFELREYQKEAFARFFQCYKGEYERKEYPLHFLFNMATGSGKTLIMAGLILYLYNEGYRNFLFFVNSTNIIEKTKDNFLNNLSKKYLFNKEIFFSNQAVTIQRVDNFDGVSEKNINICFTTIQKLHGDLYNEKENLITIKDFKNIKIALISDEAHHGQVQTKNGQSEIYEKPNWENTVEQIFKQNDQNILLEFTATMDFLDKNIVEKYRNKVIYKYELKEFRNDGFSKEVELLHTDTDKKDRIIQALILNQYRQEVAGKYGINLKPVILFKAQKTIAQSEENKKIFHKIIEDLSVSHIQRIRQRSNLEILNKAFSFFKEHKITDSILIRKLKVNFAENKTLSVNEEEEKEKYQLLINDLENDNNQIRAIFAVQKLNEGWDVLNLFDIVRLYETRDSKNAIPGRTTISEAQLIGRGARYFPFKLGDSQDKYKRKYDQALDNELRVLEELHYHCHPGYKSRYIAEIKSALIKEGMLDESEIEVELKLKEEFKKTSFYKSGLVYKNERNKRSFEKVQKIEDLGVTKKNIIVNVFSGAGKEMAVFAEQNEEKNGNGKERLDIKLSEIEPHVIKNALTRNEFYTFNNLKHFFPSLNSISEFINNRRYLNSLSITFVGNRETLRELNNGQKYYAILALLNQMEVEIKSNLTEYVGTEFSPAQFKEIFRDKLIKIKKGNERVDGQEQLLTDKKWYVFNANYGTSEEKAFVEFISSQILDLNHYFDHIFLVRNERQLKIFNFHEGQAFEPDYLLFLIKNNKNLTYQFFLEPKGQHLAEHDKWKNDFLEEIKKRYGNKVLVYSPTKKYKVIGVPFYQSENENEFKEKLYKEIKK
ncbi:MAG: DEAD/DEAH box helicase family protein [Patescibacteria group bacterium]